MQGGDTKLKSSHLPRNQENVSGVSALLCASLTSAVAGIVLEKIYKSSGSGEQDVAAPDVLSRNIQLSIVSLPFDGGVDVDRKSVNTSITKWRC